MSSPERPTDARIIRNGEIIPLELVYAGDINGVHVWEAATGFNPRTDQLRLAKLPARTGIRFKCPEDAPPRIRRVPEMAAVMSRDWIWMLVLLALIAVAVFVPCIYALTAT